jgi:(1->4)-alpha-D-glucan 1-alpha-D-glucosylmutase
VTAFRATYRLQLAGDFGFAAARELVPYLADLGVSHLYLPPSFQARPGSTHGYDVVDPGRFSDALGGEEGFRALADAAHEAGLGVVLDIVPNHMATDDANRWWAEEGLRKKFFDVDEATGRHRRFFDIDHLAGVRQEDPEVFETTHELALRLARDGVVDGLRVDHPDGLADPAGYLQRLRDGGAGHVWVEKILDPGERLRDWPVEGTVGYEFLNDVAGLFVDPDGERTLTELWEEVAGASEPFGEVAARAKLEQAGGVFRADLERLARELDPPADVEALVAAVSSLPVYRTYVEPEAGHVSEEDRAALEEAGSMDPDVKRKLLLEEPAAPGFVRRFQQTTPAVMAKGVEDTAFYRHARLLALNDVGGDPSRFGIDVERFHAANLERAERFPLNLLTTMTHDAKRSADVRARIGALAALASEWADRVRHWLELAEPLRSDGAPDRIEEYFILQTLVGAWPIELDRMQAYMEKALREAKRNTNWIDHDERWEGAVKRYVAALYEHDEFLADFEPFVARVAAAGERAALGQLALKLTAPGVPDIYNGDELPLRALVDPDNRRPVDWRRRREMLTRIKGAAHPEDEPARKLWLTWRLLDLRSRRPEAFEGDYVPADTGPGVCAFKRGGQVFVAVTVRDDASYELPTDGWEQVVPGLGETHGITVLERARQ